MAAKRETAVARGTGTTGLSGAKVGRAASAGMEATGIGKGGGSEGEASGSGTLVNSNMGGWSMRMNQHMPD